MQQTALSFRFCFPQLDRQTAVSQVVNKGGIFGGFDRQQQMQAMINPIP